MANDHSDIYKTKPVLRRYYKVHASSPKPAPRHATISETGSYQVESTISSNGGQTEEVPPKKPERRFQYKQTKESYKRIEEEFAPFKSSLTATVNDSRNTLIQTGHYQTPPCPRLRKEKKNLEVDKNKLDIQNETCQDKIYKVVPTNVNLQNEIIEKQSEELRILEELNVPSATNVDVKLKSGASVDESDKKRDHRKLIPKFYGAEKQLAECYLIELEKVCQRNVRELSVMPVEKQNSENSKDLYEIVSAQIPNKVFEMPDLCNDKLKPRNENGNSEGPVPPPTLPKYTSSFNAGNNLSLRDREKEGIGGSYRMTTLDRLALRQRIIDQNNPSTNPPGQTAMPNGNNQINGNDSTATTTTTNTSIQSKRELFFKSDSTTSPSADAKDALNKKTVSVDSQDSNRLSRVTVSEKTIPEPQTKSIEIQKTVEVIKEKPKPKELDGYVGFANLPNQVYRKAVKKGFEFTLMVVGESGLGKSTLINSMFLTDIYESGPNAQFPGPSQRIKKTVNVETSKVLLKENGVNLTLTVVDTPGFGDAVDNSNCWVPIIDFIENKYEEYLNAESRVNRKQVNDSRVHCCLYFVQPSGHGLKPLDIEFMQRLCDKVNIVPVIAKADTMTTDECQLFKKQILNEIAQHKIKIYEFPDSPDDQEEETKLNRVLKSKVPFAVVGSNTVIEVDGKKVRGRKYPWGIAEVENLEHCDFIALRNMVIRTHLQDLKDVTNNVHYENYRCRKLAGLGSDGKPSRISNKNPLAQMEEEKREHDLKMKKMEMEMEQVFEMKVKEKKQKLKDSENELTKRNEQTKKQLELQAKDLEERRRQFEQEKAAWERDNNVSLEELRRKSLEANSKETVDGKEKKDKKKKGLF